MSGLFGDSWSDPKTLATLNMAAGLLGGGNFGQALGRGLQGYSGTMADAEDRAARKEDRALKKILADMQLEEMTRTRDKATKQSELLQSLFSPVSGAEAIGQPGRVGPTADKAGGIGQSKPVDYQYLLANGLDPALVKALAEAPNLGRPKVARTLDQMGPDGSKVVAQYDDYGQQVGSPVAGYVPPVQVNQGNKITFATPKSGLAFDVGMSPSERDASARGWASNRLAEQRLMFDQGQANADAGGPNQAGLVKTFGKPPANYRWRPDGTAEPIPGGPADPTADPKAKTRAAFAEQGANNVLSALSDAKKLVDNTTAGFGGSMAVKFPGTDAVNLRSQLETIKANLGFDRLQQMRDMSPTGGALGSVAVQELTALQSTVASLDQQQSPAQLRRNLEKIEGHYQRWMDAVNGKLPGQSNPAPATTFDPAKESRYQAWKRAQGVQ